MTNINLEELKKRVQELELQLSHALMAADAEARFADEFKAKYEAEKIERQFFQHGHRIASDNCVRLEGLLEEARRDAERYLRLVGSGDFVPSIFGGWALRTLTDKYATKAELDAAIDRDAARQQKG